MRPGGESEISEISGLRDLEPRYDAFILDQYGVLHNGQRAYEGVDDCLAQLHERGKPCVILSNFAGRAALQESRLPELGLDPAHVAGVITSGELAHRHLSRHRQKLGGRVLWISWPGPDRRGLDGYFDDLEGYTFTSDVEEADFIFVSGVETMFAGTPEEVTTTFERDGVAKPFTKTFRKAAQRAIPMLCANPDHKAVRPGGWEAHLPGLLAEYFQSFGGRVISFGKPGTSAFDEATMLLEQAIARCAGREEAAEKPPRICHVGDSLQHDVAGATNVGLDSALVAKTGITASELPEEPTAQDVARLCHKSKVPNPTAMLPRFVW